MEIKNIIEALPRGGEWAFERLSASDYRGVVVHHSGGAKDTIEGIAKYLTSHNNHILKNACPSIVYHYCIGFFNGEYGVWHTADDRWMTFHAGLREANRHYLAVCILGDYRDAEPDAKRISDLYDLLTHLQATYKFPPHAIRGHCELKPSTECPGKIQSFIKNFRDKFPFQVSPRPTPSSSV